MELLQSEWLKKDQKKYKKINVVSSGNFRFNWTQIEPVEMKRDEIMCISN